MKTIPLKHALLMLLIGAGLGACAQDTADSANAPTAATDVPADADAPADPYATAPTESMGTEPMATDSIAGDQMPPMEDSAVTGDAGSDPCAGLTGPVLTDCRTTESVRDRAADDGSATDPEL